MITIAAIVCTFIWLAKWGTVKNREMDTVMVRTEPPSTEGRRFDGLFVYMILYVLFLYIPSAMLPIFSFNDSIQMVLPLKEFTIKWYVELADQPGLLAALGNSLKVAIPVAITTTTLATLAAKSMTRYRLPGRSLAIGFILLPMVMPGIILAVGLFVLTIAIGMPLSLWTIGISHVVFTVPFAMLVVMARLEGFSKNIEEASLDLGENSWSTFWRITFPLILPGLGASFLLTFTASFDEFLFALFLGGSQVTLPVYMWTQVRFPQTLPTVLALGALIFMGSVVLVITARMVAPHGRQADEYWRHIGRPERRTAPATRSRHLDFTICVARSARWPYHSARLRQWYHHRRVRTPRPRNGSGGRRFGPESAWTSRLRSDSEPRANSASSLPEMVPRGTPIPA